MLVNFYDKTYEISKDDWNRFINAKPNKEFLEQCRKVSKMFKKIDSGGLYDRRWFN